MRKVTASRLIQDAIEHYEDAGRDAGEGQCHAAFGALKLAAFNHGEAVGISGRGRATLAAYKRLTDAAFNAEEAFASNCIRRRA